MIELIDVDKLKIHPNNPRIIKDKKFKELCDSVKNNFDYFETRPVLYNKQNIIFAGNQRFQAAKEIGLKQVPAVLMDISKKRQDEIMIRDNKSSGEWDWEILANEFEIEELLDFGFEEKELDLNLWNDTDESKLDEVPEIPKKALSRLGDLFEIDGKHRVLCGDSTKKEDVEKLMDGKKADMVFTDPPWNVNYGGNLAAGKYKDRKIKNDDMSTEDFKEFMDSVFINVVAVSLKGAMVYVVMSAQEWGSLMQSLAGCGYHWSSTIIWNKSSLIISRKDYHTKYEPIWYGWVDGAPRLYPLTDRKQSDVWDIDKPSNSELHPTTKPVQLICRAIVNSSAFENIVIDFFLGSGSTLIACQQTNRVCYGMEIDPLYIDVILKRYKKLYPEAEFKCLSREFDFQKLFSEI